MTADSTTEVEVGIDDMVANLLLSYAFDRIAFTRWYLKRTLSGGLCTRRWGV